MSIARREFLVAGALPALLGAIAARAAEPVDAVRDRTVHFRSDGLALSPADYARLLSRLAETPGIAVDDYSRGGVVAALEHEMAKLLGKEMAVYLPTGTLANHLAVRLLSGRRGRVLVQQESHLYNDAGDCAQQLSNLALVPLAADRASFTLDEVIAEVNRAQGGRVHNTVRAISIESPVRRRSGELFDFAEMQRICNFARERGIGLHLDGARLFLATAYSGITAAAYSAPFDTVYVSLYKYFNAASGAILAGPRRLLDNLYHERRMFGGGLPHVWPEAAVALYYLDGFGDRYGRAVAVAETLFRALGAHPDCRIERQPAGTNVAKLIVSGRGASSLAERLRSRGIAINRPSRATAETAEFVLYTNETLLRRPAPEIIGAFSEALA